MSDIRDKLAGVGKQLKGTQQMTVQNAVAYIVRLEMLVDKLRAEVNQVIWERQNAVEQARAEADIGGGFHDMLAGGP